MRRMFLTGCLLAAGILPGAADAASQYGTYSEYPAPEAYPFRHSTLAPQLVTIPPYDQPFRVRVYTTPPRQPFYNVPPYAVITPY